MQKQPAYDVDLQYRDKFDEKTPSQAELALIRSVLSELLVESVSMTEE
ncbi:MAG: hypothetical protein ACTS6J_23350 [Burkholderiales bacterium]